MILQKLIFPKPGICGEEGMYFRRSREETYYCPQEERVQLRQYASMGFDTYFNSFSYQKWKQYTRLGNLSLTLHLKGRFEISFFQTELDGINHPCQQLLQKHTVQADPDKAINLVIEPKNEQGILFFCLRALSPQAQFMGGAWETQVEEATLNSVELAINTCTYRRESYVYRNITILEQYIYKVHAECADHLQFFLTDNGSTLDTAKLNKSWIHLVRQGDNGSAGGFTRGLMQIIDAKERYGFTHAIMMDDDVCIEPEAICRNYAFLRLLKPEYKDAFIGGALLRMDRQNIQYISGGTWDIRQNYIMHKRGADLNSFSNVLHNEKENDPTVNGWWYCCIPMTFIRNDNLPQPTFFHMDDMEYDLRNCKKLILLNGIATWHEPFECKPSSYIKYYDTRNIMITHFLYFDSFTRWEMLRFVFVSCYVQFKLYRYRECKIVLDAVDDLFKGPEWIAAINPIEQFENLLKEGYQKRPLDEMPQKLDYGMLFTQLPASKWLRRLTLNGFLLPANKNVTVHMHSANPCNAYRARQILHYDETSGKAYMTAKSYKDGWAVLRRLLKTEWRVLLQFAHCKQTYQKEWPVLHTRTFWENYLR